MFGLSMQQATQIEKAPITSLQANTVRKLSTYVSFIVWVTQQKVLQVSSRNIEKLISGEP